MREEEERQRKRQEELQQQECYEENQPSTESWSRGEEMERQREQREEEEMRKELEERYRWQIMDVRSRNEEKDKKLSEQFGLFSEKHGKNAEELQERRQTEMENYEKEPASDGCCVVLDSRTCLLLTLLILIFRDMQSVRSPGLHLKFTCDTIIYCTFPINHQWRSHF